MKRLILVGMLASVPAYAFQHRDVPWFQQHPQERNAALASCRRDNALARRAVCQNAEQADYHDYARHLNEKAFGSGR